MMSIMFSVLFLWAWFWCLCGMLCFAIARTQLYLCSLLLDVTVMRLMGFQSKHIKVSMALFLYIITCWCPCLAAVAYQINSTSYSLALFICQHATRLTAAYLSSPVMAACWIH
jgi:hypothetical protein